MTTVNENIDAVDIDLDAMLADLDAETLVGEQEVAEPKKETPVDELDELLGDLDIEQASAAKSDEEISDEELEALLSDSPVETKKPKSPKKPKTEAKVKPKKDNSELYAEDEADVKPVEAAPVTKTEEVEKNKKKAAKTKPAEEKAVEKSEPSKDSDAKKATKPKSPKVDSSLPASEALFTKLGESGKNLLVIEDGVKVEAAVLDALPKKVKEKMHNLFNFLHNGVTLSTYTSRALELIVKNGEMTTTGLVENYQEKWSKGTSSSQVGQVVRLFKDLKICTVEGKTLKPNEKSRLLPLLKKHLGLEA